MRRRWPISVRLVLLIALSLLFYGGGRWLITQQYPLRYQPLLFRYAQESGLDPYLVAGLIRVESRFNPEATSTKGARGLMQIMPETGEWVAQQMGLSYSPEMLYEPEYNIRLGCWYLASLKREFGGNTIPALAAYNAGRSNVGRWLQEKRWTGERATLDQIPFAETRQYVASVLKNQQIYIRIYHPDD